MSFIRTTARIAATTLMAAAIVGATPLPAGAGTDFGFEPIVTEDFGPELPIGVLTPRPTIEWQTINGYDSYGEPFALPELAEGQVWEVQTPTCSLDITNDAWTLTVDTTYAESVVWTVDGEVVRVDSLPQATAERSPSLAMAGWTKKPAPGDAPWATPDLEPGTYSVEVQAFAGDKGTGTAGEIARFGLTVRPTCDDTPKLINRFQL